METLWSPWRQAYVGDSSAKPACVFCELASHPEDDETNFVLVRGEHNFVVLNLYPYISGHLMIAPYAHLGDLAAAGKDVSDEMMDLIKRSQIALRDAYNPQGFNVGMNLGRAAGAGIPDCPTARGSFGLWREGGDGAGVGRARWRPARPRDRWLGAGGGPGGPRPGLA